MTVQLLFSIIAVISILVAFIRRRKNNTRSIVLAFLQSFIGLVFIFSGVVKAIDPRGTAFKMKDYFESFGRDGMLGFWDFMSNFNLSFALFMIIFEIVLGVAIFVGWNRRWTTIGLVGINLFFLYLTGYSYLSGYCITTQTLIISFILLLLLFISTFFTNPGQRKRGILFFSTLILIFFGFCFFTGTCSTCEFTEASMKVKDCGCFGDFMKLKPWETFYKDIFLTIISLILSMNYHKLSLMFSIKKNNIIVALGWILATIFALYNTFLNEPVVDFRPYAIGSDIKKQMEEIKPSVYENILVYKNVNTGETKQFGLDNIPTTPEWEYADRIDKVIEEGIPAPIHNFIAEDTGGNDVTYSLLNEEQASYWITVWNADKSNLNYFKEKLVPFAKSMREKGTNVYCLVGNGNETLTNMLSEDMDLVFADETALKTMIRSNPGILKIKNGVVVDKWHYKKFNP